MDPCLRPSDPISGKERYTPRVALDRWVRSMAAGAVDGGDADARRRAQRRARCGPDAVRYLPRPEPDCTDAVPEGSRSRGPTESRCRPRCESRSRDPTWVPMPSPRRVPIPGPERGSRPARSATCAARIPAAAQFPVLGAPREHGDRPVGRQRGEGDTLSDSRSPSRSHDGTRSSRCGMVAPWCPSGGTWVGPRGKARARSG